MKKFIPLLIALVIFSGCKPDMCKDMHCANGGYCKEGSNGRECVCPDGFQGAGCQDTCPSSHTGPNCTVHKPVKKITITKVTVYGYPPLNGAQPWDPDGLADIQIYLTLSGHAEWWTPARENCQPNDVQVFTPSSEISTTDTNAIYHIQLLDYDIPDAEVIEEYDFAIYRGSASSRISLPPTGNPKIDILLSYTY